MKTCVFAGSFDPFTVGHKAVVEKLLNAGRKVIITVGDNVEKTPFFTATERAKIIRAAFRGNKNVRVIVYSENKEGYIDLLKKAGVSEYFRGIRNAADMQYERGKESDNAKAYPFIKTQYVKIGRFISISSSTVRKRIEEGKDVKRYLPKKAYGEFKKILREKQDGKN